ncbi:hypothetical protein ACFLYP_02620 [Chloroflexota bacterium]
MKNNILLGIGKWMIPIPAFIWTRLVSQNAGQVNLDFMTKEHHQVRDFVVSQMPAYNKPITPEAIAENLALPLKRVSVILDDLEKRLTFLYRGQESSVTWAYPMTSDITPHLINFDTNEKTYAA